MPNSDTDRVVFVIEDRKSGDFANVLALGQLISDRLDARVEIKRLTPRGKLLLPLLQAAMRVSRRGRAGGGLRRHATDVFQGPHVGDTRPVAVVSTLGRGEAQGAFVSSLWEAPSIHLGTPKRLPTTCFSAIVTHAGEAPKGSEIPLSVSPTRVKLRQRSEEERRASNITKVCLLLGGDARGVAHYEMRFWSRCIDAAIQTAKAYGAALTVSTSPRSGPVVESVVETAVTGAELPDSTLILYGRGDRRDIAPEVVSADVVLVTTESVSMVSDALASGARVVGLYDFDLPTSDRVRSFLGCHNAAKTLRLEDLSEWSGGPLSFSGITPLETCWSETLWLALQPVLARS